MIHRYRDIIVNVTCGESGHIGELQLHLDTIMEIKPACHRVYGLLRAVGSTAVHLTAMQPFLTKKKTTYIWHPTASRLAGKRTILRRRTRRRARRGMASAAAEVK